MKKTFALCGLLLLSAQVATAAPHSGTRFIDTWSELNTWETGARSVDFAQTLDKKLVFVLGEDGNVQIFSAVGEQLGTVQMQGRPIAIDIDPRGKILYVIDQRGYCTLFNISIATGAADSKVLRSWRTRARTVDVAVLPDRQLVFILEADKTVRVYSYSGQQIGYIPVPAGTSSLDLIPRSAMLYLVNQRGFYTSLQLQF
jgi:DNA-binding beta-propeller fold protein YncE